MLMPKYKIKKRIPADSGNNVFIHKFLLLLRKDHLKQNLNSRMSHVNANRNTTIINKMDVLNGRKQMSTDAFEFWCIEIEDKQL